MRGVIEGWSLRAGALLGRRPTLDELAWRPRTAVDAAVRLLARTAPAGGDDVLCRVLGRHKMLVDARDLSLTPHLALDGSWEMPLTRTLLRLLRPGMHVADVGANVGYHTLLMAAATGPSGRVLAFEPNPSVFRRLRLNVELNGFRDRVGLFPEPLGETEGADAVLHFTPEFLGGGFVGGGDAPAGWESTPVRTRRLDAVPGADALELIKIDAEGSEHAIWAGMAPLVAGRRLRTVLLEWEPTCHPDAGAALDGFAAAGFTFGLVGAADRIEPAGRDTLLSTPAGRATMLVLRR